MRTVVVRVLVASVAGSAMCATAAHAARTAVPFVGVPFVNPPVALAGDSIVSAAWSERGVHPSRIRVMRRGPDGTTVRLATLPALPKGSDTYRVTLQASATTWAAAIRSVHIPSDSEEQRSERGELIVSGPVTGGAPRVLARCHPTTVDRAEEDIAIAVAGDDVAWLDATCGGADGVRLARAAAPGEPAQRVGDGFDQLQLTPTHIAFHTYDMQRKLPVIDVVDRATGAVTPVDADDIDAFALGEGGLVAVIAHDDPACSTSCNDSIMRIAADGTIERPGFVRAIEGPPLVLGGGRVLAERSVDNGVVAVDLTTGAVSYAGRLGLDWQLTLPVAVDATRAIYAAPQCDGRPALYFEDTVARAPTRLGFPPCPVRVLAHTATLNLRTRRARLKVRCPRGCDGTWDVVRGDKDIGVFEFTAPARAERNGTILIYGWAVARLRGHRTVAVKLYEDPVDRPKAAHQGPIRVVVNVRAS